MLEQSSPPKAATASADATAGLSSAEAARRLAQYGRNTIAEHHTSVLVRLFKFFWGPIPWMIEMAAALSAAVRHWADFAIILAMLLVNAGGRLLAGIQGRQRHSAAQATPRAQSAR